MGHITASWFPFFILVHDNTCPIIFVEDVTRSYWLTGLPMLIVLILWVLLWIISWVYLLIVWTPSPLKRGLPLILDVLRNERWLLYECVLCCWFYEFCLKTRSVWPTVLNLLQIDWSSTDLKFLLYDGNGAMVLVFFHVLAVSFWS